MTKRVTHTSYMKPKTTTRFIVESSDGVWSLVSAHKNRALAIKSREKFLRDPYFKPFYKPQQVRIVRVTTTVEQIA
jgi:hypothetical protein